MKDLLPPHLKCKSRDPNIWVSDVIPAFKVRPMNQKDNLFAGCCLMIFAKKTKKHVVFDAQVDLDIFHRTGNFSCIRACENDGMQTICSGRLNFKDNFLEGHGDFLGDAVSLLRLQFFEDGVCWAYPSFRSGKQDDFQILIDIVRGYDHKKRVPDEPPAYNTISYLFNECGKSLLKFVEKMTNV